MPLTIADIAAGVRHHLQYPDYGRLPKSSVLQAIHNEIDYFGNELKIVNRNWLVERWPLQVDSTTDEIPVTADAWGRPFLCVTKDDSDPNHVEREVDIVVVQNRDLFYRGPKQGIGSYTQPHIAECVSFFNESGRWIAKVAPQHSLSATYEVWYQPDRGTPLILADNFPLVESFSNLFKVTVALSLLSHLVRTDDKGNVLNAGQLALLERRLMADQARYGKQFNIYKALPVLEQTGPRRGWGDDDGEVYW